MIQEKEIIEKGFSICPWCNSRIDVILTKNKMRPDIISAKCTNPLCFCQNAVFTLNQSLDNVRDATDLWEGGATEIGHASSEYLEARKLLPPRRDFEIDLLIRFDWALRCGHSGYAINIFLASYCTRWRDKIHPSNVFCQSRRSALRFMDEEFSDVTMCFPNGQQLDFSTIEPPDADPDVMKIIIREMDEQGWTPDPYIGDKDIFAFV